MKKLNSFLSVIALCSIAMFLMSCGGRTLVSNSSQVKYRNINGVITHMPVVANLIIQPDKVQGMTSGRGYYNKETKRFVFEYETFKNLAVEDALVKTGADILLEPMFTIESIGESITVKVTGYPATYSGFRNATKDDYELLKVKMYYDEKSTTSTIKTVSGGNDK
jgi:hypothetical protein